MWIADEYKKREHYFEELCNEVIWFLQNRAIAYPSLAGAINTIKSEFERAGLPNPMPTPRRLPGCRHLGQH